VPVVFADVSEPQFARQVAHEREQAGAHPVHLLVLPPRLAGALRHRSARHRCAQGIGLDRRPAQRLEHRKILALKPLRRHSLDDGAPLGSFVVGQVVRRLGPCARHDRIAVAGRVMPRQLGARARRHKG
jgi:hypothetical protein